MTCLQPARKRRKTHCVLVKAPRTRYVFSMDKVTLAQLVECTGLKPRTLQFWNLNGVILCDPETAHGGPGVPREYPEGEVAIALMLSEITRMPLQLRAVKEIADRLREIINFGRTVGVEDPVWWMDSDDGRHAVFLKAEALKKEVQRLRQQGADKNVIWTKELEEIELRRKNSGLDDWAPMQIAIHGIRRDSWAGGPLRYDPREDRMLELTIDDAGRWQLKMTHADLYEHGGVQEQAPPVWSLRLLLNLDRLFARLPSRHAEPIDSIEDAGEGAA